MSNNTTIIRNKLSTTKILLSLAISISVGNSINFYEINTEYFPNNVLNYDGSCAQFDIISFSDNKSDANNTIDILDGRLLYIDDCNNNEYYKNFNINSSNDDFIQMTHNQFINKKCYIPDGLNDTYLELNNYYNNRTKDINIISNSIHKEEILLNSNKLNNQISNTNNNDINSKYNEYYLQLSKVCNVISQEELTNYIRQIQSVLDEKTKNNMTRSIYNTKRKAMDRLTQKLMNRKNITGLKNVKQTLEKIYWDIYKSTPEYSSDREQEKIYRKKLKLKYAKS